jgi:hypothetical protein
MSSPSTSTAAARPVSGSAMSNADKNWLDTSPRTRSVSGALTDAASMRSGGKPSTAS